MKRLVCALAVALLAGCGNGSPSEPSAVPTPTPTATATATATPFPSVSCRGGAFDSATFGGSSIAIPNTTFVFRNAAGAIFTTIVSPDGYFTILLAPGNWSIQASTAGYATVVTQVTVNFDPVANNFYILLTKS